MAWAGDSDLLSLAAVLEFVQRIYDGYGQSTIWEMSG